MPRMGFNSRIPMRGTSSSTAVGIACWSTKANPSPDNLSSLPALKFIRLSGMGHQKDRLILIHISLISIWEGAVFIYDTKKDIPLVYNKPCCFFHPGWISTSCEESSESLLHISSLYQYILCALPFLFTFNHQQVRTRLFIKRSSDADLVNCRLQV